VFINEAAAVLAIVTFEHTPQGLPQLKSVHRDLGVDPKDILVGLETAHNLLIDYLWARNYPKVYVIPPSVVKGSRQRYRQSGLAPTRAMLNYWPISCVPISTACSPGCQIVY